MKLPLHLIPRLKHAAMATTSRRFVPAATTVGVTPRWSSNAAAAASPENDDFGKFVELRPPHSYEDEYTRIMGWPKTTTALAWPKRVTSLGEQNAIQATQAEWDQAMSSSLSDPLYYGADYYYGDHQRHTAKVMAESWDIETGEVVTIDGKQ
jgi:hypothetical protein